MALEIFKLVGSIMVDNSEANKSISKTDDNAKGLGSTLLSGVGTAAKWAAGLAAGAAAGAAALYGVAKNAAETTDNIDKMSQKIGISREAYQELDFVCSQSGASVDNLKVGLKTLTKQMTSARDGSASATGAFDQLGISWEDGTGKLKDQETMMWEAFAALNDMEDQTEKSALAAQLFGKAGVELMPMLNGATGSIEEMRQQAHDLGLVLSDEAIDAGVLFTDTVDQMERSFSAIVTQIGVSVMPMFQTVMEWVLDHMPQIQEVVGIAFGAIQFFVETFVEIAMFLFGQITDTIGNFGFTVEGALSKAGEIFQWLWEFALFIWESIGRPIFDTIMIVVGFLAEKFQEYMPEIKEIVGDAFKTIQNLWENGLKPAFEAIGDFISNVLAPTFKFVFDNIIGPVVDACFNGIKQLWEGTLKPILTGITDFIGGVFTGNWKRAFQGLGDIVSGVFNGLVTIVKVPINAVIGIINKFIGGLNKLSIPDWVPLVGGKGINIPEIPLLAKGGNVYSAGKAIVGEAGPELIDLPAGAKVTPISGGINGEDTAHLLKQILALLTVYLPDIKRNYQVVTDTGALIGELVPGLDEALGELARKGGRY